MTTSNNDQNKLGSIKTYMLIAWIFNIIAIIGFLLDGIYDLYYYTVAQSLVDYYGLGYYSYYTAGWATGFIVSGIVLLVFAVMAIYIFLTRINKMYKAANTGDVATLKSLNNMLWAILALIFAGVLPGILLLIAFGPINELGKAPAPPPPPS